MPHSAVVKDFMPIRSLRKISGLLFYVMSYKITSISLLMKGSSRVGLFNPVNVDAIEWRRNA
jgi:hypothetical protein